MKTIVAAVDFSNATLGVLEMAGSLAKAYGAKLHLLHVIEQEPTYTAYGFTPDEYPVLHEFQEEAKRRAARKLEDLLTTLAGDVPGTSVHLVEDSPLHGIMNYVKQTNADLVVLGSHGHGVVVSLLIGSVAEGMVRKAIVPTLIVPATSPV
ncbi:MAG: universal stress protein [Verrucomicrobiota bacterium]|jgi:nucleotide-binding universal stress UspA family protein